MAFLEDALSRAILDAFFLVFNRLGFGFLEAVYVRALVIELERAGHTVEREAPVEITYDGIVIGSYRADLLVDGRLIVEVKTDASFTSGPERQLLNYLRCSDLEVGFLLVFGIKPRFKRLIHTRDRKLAPTK